MRTWSLLGGMLCGLAAAATAEPLQLVTEDNPPFAYAEGGQVAGISTDILTLAAQRAGVQVTTAIYPWARALGMARNMPRTCVYSTNRTPEREPWFRWIGPITNTRWAFYARNDFLTPLADLSAAKPYRIGVPLNDARYEMLREQGFLHLDVVDEDRQNAIKLSAGRIDLWLTAFYKGALLAQSAGVSDIRPILTVRETDYYLACHPMLDDATVQRLQVELQALRKEGEVKRITALYLKKFRLPDPDKPR